MLTSMNFFYDVEMKTCLPLFCLDTNFKDLKLQCPIVLGIFCFWCGSRLRSPWRRRPLFHFHALSSEPVDGF